MQPEGHRVDLLAVEDVSPHVHWFVLGSSAVSCVVCRAPGLSCLPMRALPSIERIVLRPWDGGPRDPPIGGCGLRRDVVTSGMSTRRVDAVPTGRRDDRAAAMSPVACPPIGPGGRWADAAHVLFYAT